MTLFRGVAPKCKCGCGVDVTWGRKRGGWNEWIHGHHVKGHPRPDLKGRVPWNKGSDVSYSHVCARCNTPFSNKFKVAKYCSRACYFGSIEGAGSHWWTGGVRTTYKHVKVGGHPKGVHRVVMAKALGRPLSRIEVVHHVDGNGLNNDASNLHLFHCDSCHLHFHRTPNEELRYIYMQLHVSV